MSPHDFVNQEINRRDAVRLGLGVTAAAPLAGLELTRGAAPPAGGPPLSPVTSRNPQYPDLVSGLNQRWVGTPDEVWQVTSTQQVVDAVQDAVDRGRRIGVKSGGHCFENFVFSPDVRVVVDLGQLRRVGYDPARNAVMVEAGATTLDVYQATYPRWGVTIPAGFCASVGMGGFISGGGWGPQCRQQGLVVDHLYALEVVVVDRAGRARAVVATREPSDPNRELWWAHTGGGGGSFGVVTRYWFRSPGATGSGPAAVLPSPPARLLVSALAWPWAELDEQEFGALLRNYADWHVAHQAPDSPGRILTSVLVLTHRSAGQIPMLTLVDATAPDAEAVLEDYVRQLQRGVSVEYGAATAAAGELPALPAFLNARELPWLQATRMIGISGGAVSDPTLRAKYKSTYMRAGFPDAQLAAIHRNLTSTGFANPNAGIQLTSYGGQVAAAAPDATAAQHRDAAFKMMWMTLWTSPADDAANLGWIRRAYQETYAATGGVPVPGQVTDGCYVNYPDVDLGDPEFNRSGVPWHDLYHKHAYPRLQQVKRTWDPGDVFHHGQSVRLP